MLVGFIGHDNPPAQHWKIENMSKTIIEALLAERAGYVNRKLEDRVKQVDACLRELGFEHNSLLAHGFERIFGNISNELNLPILGIILDIQSNVYHSNFKLYKEFYDNNIVFKINNIITLPNESEIKLKLNNKLKLINSLVYIRNVR
jgi:hypothetical protein